MAPSCWLLGMKYPGSRPSDQKGGLRIHTGWPWILLRRGRVREFSTTNVPHRSEQHSGALRAGAPAVSNLSATWMKAQFDPPPNESAPMGSAYSRPQLQPLTAKRTERHSLTPIASAFKPQIPQLEGFAEEFGNSCSASRTTSISGSATEPDELEGFQPSLLCNRSLPIYLLTTQRFPQIHSNKCED